MRMYFQISSREAKNLIEAAEKIGLVGINYVWILTSTSIGSITKRTSSYPLGTLEFEVVFLKSPSALYLTHKTYKMLTPRTLGGKYSKKCAETECAYV
ncbi:hypothetical protein KUTeg_003505 [Tegillarca granosa]|uniref:Uncharacterized protein n=1 Tax=Tegillarca granosa TaxID=220873 RepID=A0ABQ9FMC1_TEGGR|nr:hypothetical protein KUTeg_003505 [Tegillarca granosa]